jgi:hypothetical protein
VGGLLQVRAGIILVLVVFLCCFLEHIYKVFGEMCEITVNCFICLILVLVASHVVLLALISVSAVFHLPNLVPRTNSSSIAMWLWPS